MIIDNLNFEWADLIPLEVEEVVEEEGEGVVGEDSIVQAMDKEVVDVHPKVCRFSY